MGALLWGIGAMFGSGCFSAPPEAVARLEAVKAQAKSMDAALDEVEERLLGNQAAVHLWQEMGRRHRNVSAVACENAAQHVAAMEVHQDKQQKKKRRISQQRMQADRSKGSDRVTSVPVQGRRSRNN